MMWKQIVNISKVIGAVSGIAVAALWMNGKFNTILQSNDAVLDSIADVRLEVHYLQVGQGFQDESLLRIEDTVERLDEYNAKQDESLKEVVWIFRHEAEFNRKQRELLFDEWSKKNSSSHLLLTPDGWIRPVGSDSVNESELGSMTLSSSQ